MAFNDNPRQTSTVGLAKPYQPPRTPLERQLALIWAAVLGVAPVGITDEFLGLGGNSLHAIQIQARLVSQLQIELPVRNILTAATIGELAVQITQQQAAQLDEHELAQMLIVLETSA